jgi:hypothetical protein
MQTFLFPFRIFAGFTGSFSSVSASVTAGWGGLFQEFSIVPGREPVFAVAKPSPNAINLKPIARQPSLTYQEREIAGRE